LASRIEMRDEWIWEGWRWYIKGSGKQLERQRGVLEWVTG
jgi:hypothetical protein